MNKKLKITIAMLFTMIVLACYTVPHKEQEQQKAEYVIYQMVGVSYFYTNAYTLGPHYVTFVDTKNKYYLIPYNNIARIEKQDKLKSTK